MRSSPAIPANNEFHHLRTYLTGNAATTTAEFSMTETCYADPIAMLNRHFEDKQKIDQEQLTALRRLPRVMSANDLRALNKPYDATELNLRNLIAL